MEVDQEPSCPQYKLETHTTSTRDNDALFTVRCSGKLFYIRTSLEQFVNSPATKEKYLLYLEVLRSGEEVIDDVFDTDVYDWVTQPFEPLFAELAPSSALLGHPADIKVTLQEYLFPEFFVFDLHIVDEKLQPRRVEMEISPYSPPRTWLDDEILDDLEEWTALYDPAGIVLSFDRPEDALIKPPGKVLIDDGQTACFFKPCDSLVQPKNEVEAYKMILEANLDPQLYICRLHGVVMDDANFVFGLLLTYIDHVDGAMSNVLGPNYPPASTKQRWMGQLDAAVAELNRAGIAWGDVKAQNVLIDQEDNAWVIDFGGGHTPGWVDSRMEGTVEGDLAGMAKLREFIFQEPGQDRWWRR